MKCGMLKTGTRAEKVAAAVALAERREAASGTARALLKAATSSDKEVSRAALGAMEKVAPRLQEPVFTLVVDGQAANHRKAIAALRRLEDKGKPAMPVLLFELKKSLADLDALDQQRLGGFGKGRKGSAGWGGDTLIHVIDDGLKCIPEIAPEHPDGAALIISAGRLSLKNLRVLLPGKGIITKPFRTTAIPLLGTVAAKQPELRKVILPALSGFLDKSMQQLDEHSTNPKTKNNSFSIDHDLRDIESIGAALQGCGPDAKGPDSSPELRTAPLCRFMQAGVPPSARRLPPPSMLPTSCQVPGRCGPRIRSKERVR
jgi:hypothetical protein